MPQTAFTGLANTAANLQMAKNQPMPSPANTGNKMMETTAFDESLTPKRRRIDSQSQHSIQGQPTIVPLKTNSIYEPILIQNASTLSPNQRLVSQSATNSKNILNSSSRTVLSASNCYTMGAPISSQSVGQTGTRVIFVSSTPTSTTSNVLNATTKNLTAFPLIARHTIGSPQKPTIDIPRTKQRPGRPPTINTSIVGLIGVSGAQKQVKAPIIKTTLNSNPNLSVAQSLTTIPFLSGTKVFTKSGGQQQVVVFPVNQKPLTVPIGQAVKAISIPSSTSSSMTTNTPTFIYQSAANMKTVQKVQTPNLIIMQPKQIIQTSKPLTIPTTAITLSKANIAKTQIRTQVFSGKKQSTSGSPKFNESDIKYSTETSNITESQKIVAKKLQTSPKSLQEINASLPEFAEQEIFEIDASNETIAGLINSVKVRLTLITLF